MAALADPTRRQLVEHIGMSERTVTDLVAAIRLPQPAVSRHLRVLRDADLVDVRVDGQRRWYRLRPGPFCELDAWLQALVGSWSTTLDRLEMHLDSTREVAR